jgi:hypothetical protein
MRGLAATRPSRRLTRADFTAVTPVWDVISDLFHLMGHRQAEGGALAPNCQSKESFCLFFQKKRFLALFYAP